MRYDKLEPNYQLNSALSILRTGEGEFQTEEQLVIITTNILQAVMYVSTVLTLYIVLTTILKVNTSVLGCWIFFFSPLKILLQRLNQTFVCVLNRLSCLTLCFPMGCSLPGSSVHGILRQEYWSGLPCPPPGIFLTLGSNPQISHLPALAGGFFTTSATWEVKLYIHYTLENMHKNVYQPFFFLLISNLDYKKAK